MSTVHPPWHMLAIAIVLMAGCSAEVSIGDEVIDAAELEQEVSDELAAEVGQTPKSVDCPDELVAEEGAQVRCTLTAEDDSVIGLTVTVTSLEDGQADFDIEVDDEVQ